MKKDSYIPLPREEYALADMLQTERELLHLYAAALGEGFSGGLRTLLTEKFLEGSEDAKRIADERALRRGMRFARKRCKFRAGFPNFCGLSLYKKRKV